MRHVELTYFDSNIALKEVCALLTASYFKKCVFNNLSFLYPINSLPCISVSAAEWSIYCTEQEVLGVLYILHTTCIMQE